MLAKLCDTPTRVVTAYLAAADRREVDPPIQVEAATWLALSSSIGSCPESCRCPRCSCLSTGTVAGPSRLDESPLVILILPCCTLLPGPTSTRVAPSPSKPATSVNWCSGRRSRCGRSCWWLRHLDEQQVGHHAFFATTFGWLDNPRRIFVLADHPIQCLRPEPRSLASMVQASWQTFDPGWPHTLIVVDVVNPMVVWAAGGGFPQATQGAPAVPGTVVRTVNGGQTWQNFLIPPDGTAQEFRDVEAFNPNRAVVLAPVTPAGYSRIFRTANGGNTWDKEFDANQSDFYDSMAFFDHRRGLAVERPGRGGAKCHFPILGTEEGVETWELIETSAMPRPPSPWEFAVGDRHHSRRGWPSRCLVRDGL